MMIDSDTLRSTASMLLILALPATGWTCGGSEAVPREVPATAAPRAPVQKSARGAKPLLSERVRQVAMQQDAAAARVALGEIQASGLDAYEMDEEAVLAIVREQLDSGAYEMAQVVVEFQMMAGTAVTGQMSAPVLAAMGDIQRAQGQIGGANALYSQALSTDPDYTYAKEQLAALEGSPVPAPVKKPAATGAIGRRDDLARFKGRFAMEGNPQRVIAVSETCYRSGVLQAAAMWGDVAPWTFRSVSDAVFEQANTPSGATPVRFLFELDPGTAAEALVVSGGLEGHFTWSAELPDGFEPPMGSCEAAR